MLRLAVLLTTCFVVTTVHADVYRFVDSKGQVQYTDSPETLPAELLQKIKSQRTDSAAVADRVAAEQKQSEAAKTQQPASPGDAKKAQQSTAADKADRCAKARERYDQVMSAQRLYSTNDKGERAYMDDKQIDQARASAKQLMDTWCN